MAANHPWTIDQIMEDINGLLDHLKIDKAHIVGGKSGGTIAMKYAAERPAVFAMRQSCTSPGCI